MALFKRRNRSPFPDPDPNPTLMPRDRLPQQLLWLSDSPMFLDADQVGSFYDATIRPEYKESGVELSDSVTRGTEIAGGLKVGSAFPWVKATGNISGKRARQTGHGKKVTLQSVDTAQRQLVHLALYYVDQYLQPPNSRTRMVTCTTDANGHPVFNAVPDVAPKWDDPSFIAASPRAMLFIDLPPGIRFIPTALETVDGDVVTLYDQLMRKFARPHERPPDYPSTLPRLSVEREAYWAWCDERFSDVAAMKVVEEAVNGRRIAWIDYRVSTGIGKHFLHLHIAPRGKYDTGSFAYQFIKRGYKHGLRLVGTLKSKPDMNVLAVFEK